jgi:cellulose synthase operon protein C
MKSRSHAVAAVVLAALLAACSSRESPESMTASAQKFFDAKDYRAATIQLKSLLQETPGHGPARLLLGKALLESGDPAGAVAELRRARELAVADEQALPPLARALVLVGEERKLLAEFSEPKLRDPEAQADVLSSLATATLIGGNKDKALELSNQALRAKPGFASALILQAGLKLSEKDIDSALLLLEDVLQREPGNERAGVLKGHVLAGAKQDRPGAMAAYRKVLESTPAAVPAHVALVSLLRQDGKPDDAKAQLAALKKAAPNHPETLALLVQQHYADAEYPQAREINERLLKAMPENPRVLFMAGAVEYRLKNYPAAEGHLAKAVKAAPGYLPARQMLAQTFLRVGQPNKSLELLGSVIESDKADGPSLALAGEAYLALGDAKRADAAFSRASKAAPDDPRVRTAVAMGGVLSAGGSAESMAALEEAAASDKTPRADLALISARMQKGDLAGALKGVDALQAKMGDKPLPDLLRGRLLLARKDVPGATAAFEAALKKDPKYFPAIAAMAGIELAGGKPAEARKRLEAAQLADPSNYQIHIALAELTGRQGGSPADVSKGLAEAVKANPTQIRPRIILIEQLMRTGDTKAALNAAQDAVAALPTNLEALEALGRVQMAAGEGQQAVSTLSKLSSQQPLEPRYHLRLTDAYMLANDVANAKRSAERALELDPKSLVAKRSLAAISVQQGRPAEAMAVAKEIQKAEPRNAAGWLLEGDIERSQRNMPGAAAAYRQALALARNTDNVVKLHQALIAAGQNAEADKLADGWRKEFPKDGAFSFYLGDLAIGRKNWPAAEAHYRAVLEIQPRNALALNNVAWLMVQQGKPGALALAEEANQLLPNRATLLDTLATAQAAENKLDKAIETQKRALVISPQDPSLRLGLARLLLKHGKKPEGVAELEELARLGDKFAGQAEVAALLQSAR